MTNLGKVDIKGLDVTGSILASNGEITNQHFRKLYLPRALDVTSATDNTYKKTYKHQIAYTPRVSGSGQAGIETPWINLSYAFLFSGKRYTQGENISQNRLDGYSDHSLSASRNLKIRDINTSLSIEVLNLLNKNYEIIKSFPMPGRSVRATLKITY